MSQTPESLDHLQTRQAPSVTLKVPEAVSHLQPSSSSHQPHTPSGNFEAPEAGSGLLPVESPLPHQAGQAVQDLETSVSSAAEKEDVERLDVEGFGAPGKRYYNVNDSLFEIDARYEPTRLLGEGSYATVCEALDRETGELVAIKKLQYGEEWAECWRLIAREITLLRQINHPFVVRIKNIMRPPTAWEYTFTTVYIVLELVHTDLTRVLKTRSPFSNDERKLYLNQLLRVLKYIHAANVVHRDLKPSNILVDENKRIKVCDFGLARELAPGIKMTEAPGQLFYLAPELLAFSTQYTTAVDIWSAGCIFARLLQKEYLFSAKTKRDLLWAIAKVIPKPKTEDLDFLEDVRIRSYISQLPEPSISLREKYRDADPAAIDLLEKMLVFDPRKRITAAEALRHPYMEDITLDDLKHKLKLSPSEVEILSNEIPLELEHDREELIVTSMSEAAGRTRVYRELLFYSRPEDTDDHAE